ncbi:glycosyltransferase family 9 protein [Amycolatopsis benzoatilytica]|uniref:glycosyltransferase family 9 protein n=1 Tax=Amycolatopsis benzoatilytica TaxID=346045 RepID=UPI0003602135|nr:glycosyltransferase family 9 protein [Amycolatopsis benzoatilytica]
MAVSVLVLRALGIGDLLTAVPALRALRRAYPGERLVLAAPEPLRDLVELVGAVDELLPTAGLGQLAWPGPPPRLAANLHGRGPESIRDLLAVQPDALLTHRHPALPEVPGLDWAPGLHEVDRWCRLVEYGGAVADRADLRLPAPPGPSPAPGAVVVHPGAAFPARRWPPERFAEVARDLAAAGHRVVVTGTAAEQPLANEVAEGAGLPADAVLAGETDLAGLAALVAGAALVVCGDTGVGHLATAFGTPSVLLFGPTPPRCWGPPPDAPQHVALWVGDVGDPHGAEPDAGLLLLSPGRVLAAAHAVVRKGVSHG